METAIARNTSTQVTALSQAGKRKAFDALEEGFQSVYPNLRLRKSETDTEPDSSTPSGCLNCVPLSCPRNWSMELSFQIS